jgi:ornithine cyclodeaminase/alanine dehydrogenase
MLLLDRSTLESLLDVRSVIAAVEAAFAAHARGQTRRPAKVYLPLPEYGGDLRAMPAYVGDAAGVKWVNSHPRNPAEHGRPTVMGVVLLNDPRTGQPLAIMDGTIITSLRTGAAAAVATRQLARADARTLGLIGCGAQAPYLLRSIAAVRDLAEVRLFDRDPERARALAERMDDLPARPAEQTEVAAADIVTTATPGLGVVLEAGWLRPGAHVNAIGADGPGKQELDPAILTGARVVVDDLEQAVHGGELNVAIERGLFRQSQIAATLGEVVAGLKPGRQRADQITVFDSTGLAIQDIATASLAYARARERGLGQEIELG